MASLIRLLDNLAAVRSATIGSVGDPDGTRTITSIVALLIALGIGLLLLAVWLWRSTRPDPEFLAPLEVMGERKWRRSDPVWQRRRLDELRPEGAEPLVTSVAPPEIDEAFEAGPTAAGFDDLHGDRLPSVPSANGSSLNGASKNGVEVPARRSTFEPPTGKPVGAWTPTHMKRPPVDDVPAVDDLGREFAAEDADPG